MRSLFLFILLFIVQFYVVAQKPVTEIKKSFPKPFVLSISLYNHAELLFKGTTIYNISGNQLKVSNQQLFDSLDKVIYSKQLSKSEIANIKFSLEKLDTLNELYMNYCVMPTSGEEFSMRYEINTIAKVISLHQYYLEQIKDLIDSININLPKKYKMRYLTKENKQDCALYRGS
jgi:hypothetical protein